MALTIIFKGNGPITGDLPVVRGEAGAPASIGLDLTGAPLAADEAIILTIANLDGVFIRRSTLDASLSLVDNVATWLPTIAETRAVRPGRVVCYSFERRSSASASVLANGYLIGLDL